MGLISARVAVLAEGVLKAMWLAKLKTNAVVLLGLGMIAFGGMLSHLRSAPPPPVTQKDLPSNLATQEKAGQPIASAPVKAGPDIQAVDHQGAPLPPGAVVRIGSEQFRHQGEAWSVSFSPDGNLLAATSRNGQIYLWDAASGKEVRRLAGTRHVFAIDFSPDGKLLASRWTDRSIRIWEIATGKEVLRIAVNERMPREHGEVCFTPDGKAVVVASWDIVGGRVESRVSFFEATTGKDLVTWNRPGQVGSFAISPDGKSFAVAVYGEVSAVEIWDLACLTKLRSLPGHKSGGVLTFSADGRMLASGTNDQVVVSDVFSGKVIAQLAASMGVVMGLAFTPEGKTLISAGQDGKVIFWDLASKKVRLQRDARMWMIRSMALSRDGKTVAVGTVYNAIRCWDVASGRELSGGPEEPDAPINTVVFSPDGKLLATGGDNHHICLWEVPSGRPRLRFSSPNSAKSVAFSQDGKLLATVWPNSQITRLWDVATGQITSELKRQGIGASCVAFSPDGETLVTAHSNLWHSAIRSTSLNFWLVKGGKHLREYPLQTASVEAVAYAPGGKTLAIATGNGTIHIWDILAGNEISRLTGHKHSVSSVAFSPDGKVLGSGSTDQTVKLWEPISGKELLSLQGHQRAVTSIAFSPDGRILISGSGDPHYPIKAESPHRIRFWEVATGIEITHLQGHQCDVRALSFSPDGSRMASALGNATVLLWDMGALQAPSLTIRSLTDLDIDRLWNDLAGADAHKAYQAIWALAAKPDKSIPLLRDRLKPVAAVDAGKIQRWIADLDSGQFSVRQAALTELEKLGGQAEMPVQKALGGKVSLETRRRLEQVLKTVQGVPGSTTVRHLRAIMVLELVASPEARKILDALAQGAPERRETHEAKVSLERIAKRAIIAP
jgi:WD40 repeat protein